MAVENAGKRYKKHLIKKRFEEDAGASVKIPKKERTTITEKL